MPCSKRKDESFLCAYFKFFLTWTIIMIRMNADDAEVSSMSLTGKDYSGMEPAFGSVPGKKPASPVQKHVKALHFAGRQVNGVRFIQADSLSEVGQLAAGLVREQLQMGPNSVIVFPTGKTPLPMYQQLRAMKDLDWRSAHLFHLDEYLMTGAQKVEPYADYMNRELWAHVSGHKYYLRDDLENPTRYEQKFQDACQGKPSLVILGIGSNGHLAFNEPGSTPDAPTRTVALAPATCQANFGLASKNHGYPTHAVTMGLKNILQADRVVLLATGKEKQDVVRRAFDFSKPPELELPASWLKNHKDVVVITDFKV